MSQDNPSSFFRFYVATTLAVSNNVAVNLSNGTLPCNVFWLVGASATFGTSSILNGVVLANNNITMGANSRVTGRLLTSDSVVMNATTVQQCDCSA